MGEERKDENKDDQLAGMSKEQYINYLKQQNDGLTKKVQELHQQNAKEFGFYATDSRELNMTLDEMSKTLPINEIREQIKNIALIRHEIKQCFGSERTKEMCFPFLKQIKKILGE